MERIALKEKLSEKHKITEPLTSYNIEMTEVTGGTFWKEYTKEQISGQEKFPEISDWSEIMTDAMQIYPPINLYNKRLRALAKALGPVWIRVSGGWANSVYYDFDHSTNGKAPDGYQNVLTKEQWNGVLDFVKAVDGKLMISVAVTRGAFKNGAWDSGQAKLILDYSRNYGVPVSAVEFANEPNVILLSDMPEGYGPSDYSRDHDAFARFIHANYPEVLLAGHCSIGDSFDTGSPDPLRIQAIPTEELIKDCKEDVDVFSYHCYNGVSERGMPMGGHWPAQMAMSEEYLDVTYKSFQYYNKLKEKFFSDIPVWITESADAGCGGNTWATTYLDVIRTINELGVFSNEANGVIFHNTLASSDYGWLSHDGYQPRPNYFAVLLWSRLMGDRVYKINEPIREGCHVFAHSRKDGKNGVAYAIVNNSKKNALEILLPKKAECYILSPNGNLRSETMLLNGRELALSEDDALPDMSPIDHQGGSLKLNSGNCAFIVL